MRIAILAYEGCLGSAVTGLVDLFWIAQKAQNGGPGAKRSKVVERAHLAFETRTASLDGATVRDAHGRELVADMSLDALDRCDAVLVSGMLLGEDGVPPVRILDPRVCDWLRRRHTEGALIGGCCAGVFVLGEAGLLAGRRCTTTWWLHNELKRRFPRAEAAWGSALVEDERIVTVGGPLSWVDLALHMIGRLAGKEAARLAADFAVVDSTPLPQASYAPRGYVNAQEPLLLSAEQIVRQAGAGLTAAQLATALNLSERTLHRRLKDLVGEGPQAFIRRVRMETAQVLLENAGTSIKQAAQLSGYSDEASFRRAFVQQVGMTPGSFRQRRLKRDGA